MKLFLLRHGDSEARAASDDLRQLTHRGRQQALDVSLQFCDKGGRLDRCIVSPYTRAVQTAASFLARIPDGPAMQIEADLTPEIRAAEVMNLLSTFPLDESILLVSHNPLISELNAVLVEGTVNHNMMILGTCDLCAIDMEIVATGMGVRQYMLSPRNV